MRTSTLFSSQSNRPRLLIALCGIAASASTTFSDTWDNSAGNAQWSTITNWLDNTEPTNADAAIFPTTIPLNQATILMTTTEFCASLAFNNDYTLQGGQMFIINGGVDVASGRTATINTVINGSAGLTKTGGGTLRLLPVSSNAFSGLISITGFGSTLYVRSNVVLGNTANDITISGGRLQLDGITNPNFLITGRTITAGALGGTIELLNNAFLDLNQALGANANPLTFTGSGTVELNSPSTRTGSTFVSVPLLRINSATALGTPGSVSLSSGAVLEINNGSGIFAGTVFPSAGTTIRGGTGTHTFNGFASVAGPMTLNGGLTANDTLILGTNGASVWNNGSGATTIGTGTVQLNSANNYVGDWTINGTLQVNHPGALGTGITPILVGPPGHLILNTPTLARDITLNNPGGGIQLLQDVTVTGDIAVAPSTAFVPIIGPDHEFTLTGASSSFTYSGIAFFGGASGVGSFRVTAGADVTGGSTRLYGITGAPGSITVSGAGSTWVNTGEMWIGNTGEGTLTVEAGAAVSCPGVFIGVVDNGAATITGENSSLTSTALLKIGLASQSTMAVLAGADVTAFDTYVGEGIDASGTLTINGAGSTWTNQGLLIVGKAEPSGGTPAAGAVNLSNGGTLSCLGLHLGDVATASSTLTIQGGLTRLDCGASGVLMSQNGASSTLNLPGGIVHIDGDITDGGAGVSAVIMDGATLDMMGHAIGAGPSPIDNIQFRSGTLKNVAQINNGAGLTKTGPNTLYLNTNNTYTGSTNINQGTLFVVNLSGSATGPGLVTVAAGATLAGPGIIGGLVANDGIVAPEGFNFNPVGTLTVNGTYSQFATGTLRIDIASAVSNDRVVVTGGGASVAAGTLDVQLVNGFTPAQGDSFTILEAAFISGQFPTTNLPALSSGLLWQVEYLPNSVRLAVVSDCPADFNSDGGTDFFDYLDFVDAFSANDPAADFNQDGGIDFFDYLDFVDAFSAGC